MITPTNNLNPSVSSLGVDQNLKPCSSLLQTDSSFTPIFNPSLENLTPENQTLPYQSSFVNYSEGTVINLDANVNALSIVINAPRKESGSTIGQSLDHTGQHIIDIAEEQTEMIDRSENKVLNNRCVQVCKDSFSFVKGFCNIARFSIGIAVSIPTTALSAIVTLASLGSCTKNRKTVTKGLAKASARRIRNVGIGLINLVSEIFCKCPIAIENNCFNSKHFNYLHRLGYRKLKPFLLPSANEVDLSDPDGIKKKEINAIANAVDNCCLFQAERFLVGVNLFRKQNESSHHYTKTEFKVVERRSVGNSRRNSLSKKPEPLRDNFIVEV